MVPCRFISGSLAVELGRWVAPCQGRTRRRSSRTVHAVTFARRRAHPSLHSGWFSLTFPSLSFLGCFAGPLYNLLSFGFRCPFVFFGLLRRSFLFLVR